jgi:hypothetical protein
MFKKLLVMLAMPTLAFAVGAFAENAPPRLLHNLNAGTKLVTKKPIIIPANADQIALTNGAAPGSVCKLRVKEPKPFDRILPPDQALTVAGASRAGFASSHRLSLSTYVRVDSHSLDDFVCVADRGAHEMTVNEFERIIAADFSIQLSNQVPTVID